MSGEIMNDPALCANMNMRRAARSLGQYYDLAMSPVGIKSTQYSLLVHVEHLSPIAISSLATAIEMDRTTLTRNLGLLEKSKLVNVIVGEDARTRMATLTDAGKVLIKEGRPYWQKAQRTVVELFGNDRMKKLLAELRDLQLQISSD